MSAAPLFFPRDEKDAYRFLRRLRYFAVPASRIISRRFLYVDRLLGVVVGGCSPVSLLK